MNTLPLSIADSADKRTQQVRQMNPRFTAVLLLSFSSGLPLVLVGSTLQAWYTAAGANLMTIGLLTLVGQPYVYKFLWAPIMDRFAPNRLGRRRGWIFLMQAGLVVALAVMAFMDPLRQPGWLAAVAFLVALFSASQDIAFDAYRTDVLRSNERGMGAALNTLGYRVAMLVAGAIALILAEKVGWRLTYLIMTALILVEMNVTLWAPQPERPAQAPVTLQAAVVEPMRAFLSRDSAIALLAFIVLYKLCDAFSLALNTTFLMRGVGFSLVDVGSIIKVVGLVAVLLGSFLGGVVLPRWGLFRSLLVFGFLQAFANLSFMLLAMLGKQYAVMVFAVFSDYFCSGLGSVAFIAFLMRLCNRRYSATQYAIFSALAAVGRVFAGPESAYLVGHVGWPLFYFMTFLIGMPPLVLLCWLKRRVSFLSSEVA